MAVECTTENLTDLAACFSGLSPQQMSAVKIYLLAVAAGVDPDPATIIEASKCLTSLSQKQQAAAQTYLLCQIANA